MFFCYVVVAVIVATDFFFLFFSFFLFLIRFFVFFLFKNVLFFVLLFLNLCWVCSTFICSLVCLCALEFVEVRACVYDFAIKCFMNVYTHKHTAYTQMRGRTHLCSVVVYVYAYVSTWFIFHLYFRPASFPTIMPPLMATSDGLRLFCRRQLGTV